MAENPAGTSPSGRAPTNGNGSYVPGRLAGVEARLAALEAHMQHMATKAWVLGGVVGGMGLAAGVTLAIIKLFST